jgi:hypothetical protein
MAASSRAASAGLKALPSIRNIGSSELHTRQVSTKLGPQDWCRDCEVDILEAWLWAARAYLKCSRSPQIKEEQGSTTASYPSVSSCATALATAADEASALVTARLPGRSTCSLALSLNTPPKELLGEAGENRGTQ